MPKDEKSAVFEETYRNYMKEIQEIDLEELAGRMGMALEDGSITVPLFGRPYRISAEGITGPGGEEPIHAEKVALCRYVLLYPEKHPEEGDGYVSYRDFKGSAPFVGGFKTNAEIPIAKNFAGKLEELEKACAALGGRDPETELNYDLCMEFEALPRVPVVLLFNDEDEEFPSSALILFERRAERYLDMECLAIAGWLLADYLAGEAGIRAGTIM